VNGIAAIACFVAIKALICLICCLTEVARQPL
jgi:hypothetical protein